MTRAERMLFLAVSGLVVASGYLDPYLLHVLIRTIHHLAR